MEGPLCLAMLTSFIDSSHQPFDEFERLWVRPGLVDHGPVEHLGRDACHLAIPFKTQCSFVEDWVLSLCCS